LRWTH